MKLMNLNFAFRISLSKSLFNLVPPYSPLSSYPLFPFSSSISPPLTFLSFTPTGTFINCTEDVTGCRIKRKLSLWMIVLTIGSVQYKREGSRNVVYCKRDRVRVNDRHRNDRQNRNEEEEKDVPHY